MSDQACAPTKVCVRYRCERALLVPSRRELPHWVCPKCGDSYGSQPHPDLLDLASGEGLRDRFATKLHAVTTGSADSLPCTYCDRRARILLRVVADEVEEGLSVIAGNSSDGHARTIAANTLATLLEAAGDSP